MNSAHRLLLALVAIFLPGIATGATYMHIVGELAGKALAPMIVMEYCSAKHPSRTAEYEQLYTEWRERHSPVLEAIDEQIRHADIRLLRQGAPGGDSPVQAAIKSIRDSLRRQFELFTPEQAELLCNNYPAFLESKDRDFETAIPSLLSEAVEMDKALATREPT